MSDGKVAAMGIGIFSFVAGIGFVEVIQYGNGGHPWVSMLCAAATITLGGIGWTFSRAIR